jgi:hypothetical protein
VFVVTHRGESGAPASGRSGWVVERRDVQVLETTGNRARIEGAALEDGLPVVTEGLHRLVPGMRVEPREIEGLHGVAEADRADAAPVGMLSGDQR